jgi:hypothetical protein
MRIRRRRVSQFLDDVLVARKLILPLGNPRGSHDSILRHDEQRGARDVPRVDAHFVPHAVGLRDRSILIDQDMEGQSRLFDVAAYRRRALRDDRDDLVAALRVFRGVACQFTEPAAAVGSPGSAMKGEQDGSFRQVFRKRTDFAPLCRQRELRRAIAGTEGRGCSNHRRWAFVVRPWAVGSWELEVRRASPRLQFLPPRARCLPQSRSSRLRSTGW